MTPFHDLQDYIAIPRVEALRLSPDGRRLVAVVKALSPDGKKHASALWEIDPGGTAGPRRLTRSVPGEANPAFAPDGTLLFVSERPGPQAAQDDQEENPALWALPASGGEAARIAARPGQITALTVARDAGTIAFSAPALPGDAAADGERRKKRADAGITAILHEDYPVRHWDHELGPDQPRLFILRPDAQDPATQDLAGQACPDPRDVTPQAGQAQVEQSAALTPDGSTAITGWWVTTEGATQSSELATIDLATGRRRTLLAREGTDLVAPVAAPDGRAIVCTAKVHGTTDQAPYRRLWLVPLDQTPPRELATGLDLWPDSPAWSPDSTRIYFTADQNGRGPVFVLDVQADSADQLTHDDASYADLAVSPDGSTVYALRSGIDAPPGPVRIDASTGDVTRLQAPGDSLPLPGQVTEITAPAPDGAIIRGWLWRDLVRNDVDAKFLYYPDENHWILGPGNAAVWYETVLAFLAQHVLGEPWRRPARV